MSASQGVEQREADEAGLAWFREAMAYSSVESFSREDMTAVVKAMNYRKGFYGWVLARFFEVAATGFRFETTTGVSVTVKDEPTDVWNTWGVPSSWEYGFTSLLDVQEWIPVQRSMHDDSGRVIEGATVKLPLDVLFGERQQAERDERYQQFVALKAEFEPDASV